MKKLLIFIVLIVIPMTMNAQSIFDLSRSGDTTQLKELLKNNPSAVNEVMQNGFTPLIIATYNDQLEIVKILLANKADINAQDQAGNTALMGVCFKGSEEMFDLLLANNADVNILNKNQAGALAFAATFGKFEMAKKLIAAGADKFQKDVIGQTPYQKAVMQDNAEIMRLFE